MDELRESDVLADPTAQVARWLTEAEAAAVSAFDAMVVATVDRSGQPDARVVLLRGFDEHGFRFYTNYDSAKGDQLAANPRAALVLHWREQGRQLRARGAVTHLTPEESVAYWRNRPRASQVSAWASNQSAPIASRAALEAAASDVAARLGADDLPLPPFWGGYLLAPDSIELWQHREDRLHDRLRYRRAGRDWILERLQP
jgi:pyridoxamine 5'-phosphate oxidase